MIDRIELLLDETAHFRTDTCRARTCLPEQNENVFILAGDEKFIIVYDYCYLARDDLCDLNRIVILLLLLCKLLYAMACDRGRISFWWAMPRDNLFT